MYNYLFFKSYKLGQQSGNFDDSPILGGIVWLAPCIILNIYTFLLFVEGLAKSKGFIVSKSLSYIVACVLLVLIFAYYKFNNRYRRIIDFYEKKEKAGHKVIQPFLVVIFFYSASIALLVLAGMYKNHDGIFSKV